MKILSVRTDETTKKAIQQIAKLTGLNQSQLIRSAINKIITEADTIDAPKFVKQIILEAKIQQELKHLKKLRWLNYTRNEAEQWLEFCKKLRDKEISYPKQLSKKMRVLALMTPDDITKVEQHQKNILKYYSEIESL